MKGRIKPIVIIAGIVIVLAALFVFYVCSYPYASAESEKSNWKAYFIATELYGFELENGYSNGVLIYEGNKSGKTDKVDISVKCDGKIWMDSERAFCYSRKSSGNLGSLIEYILVRKDRFYWFSEDIGFADVDLIEIDIVWEENGVKQKDSVTLDVKTAREHSIPLFQI